MCNLNLEAEMDAANQNQQDKRRKVNTTIRGTSNSRHCRIGKLRIWGSGCGAVDRAVASDFRDPRFKSSHWQFYLLPINCV